MGRSKESARTLLRSLGPLLGLGLMLEAGLVAMAVVVFRIPDTFANIYGYQPATRALFAAGWGIALPAGLDVGTLEHCFAWSWFLLNGIWLAAFLLVRRMRSSPALLGLVMVLAVLFQATMVVAMPPSLSTDVYTYLAYGRMVAFYGLNPYTVPVRHMVADPVQPLSNWDEVTTYGPVWTGLSALIALLSGRGGPFGGMLLLKGVAALSQLAIALVAYRMARGAGENIGLASAVSLGWNPLLLLEGPGNGHNDLLLMALALAGLLAYRGKRPWLGYLLLLLSMLVKYITVFLLIFYLLVWLREGEPRGRLRLAAEAAGVGLLVLGLAYAPFWQGPATILGGVSAISARIVLSPVAYLVAPLRNLWASWGYAPEQARELAALCINIPQKAVLFALLLWHVWRLLSWTGDPFLRAKAAWGGLSLVYVCFLHNAISPWYFTWPLVTAGAGWYQPTERRVLIVTEALVIVSTILYGLPL